MLVAAPLLWAGNAVVGRALNTLIPPITLNFVRWLLAFALLLPLAWQVLRPGSPLWPHWRRYALLGLLGIGSYNALQYLALQTSTPLNVTLVGSGMPVWMLIIGALCFGVPASRRQIAGVLLSVAGVVLVLSRGSWEQLLALRLGRLKDSGQLQATQISLAKWNNVRMALDIARECRDILGGAGITTEHVAIRHALNLESVVTYEGTQTVHQLVVGRELTGINAF